MDTNRTNRAIAEGRTIHRIRNIGDLDNLLDSVESNDRFLRGTYFDFENADFESANLAGFSRNLQFIFRNANFRNANIENAYFGQQCYFDYADFRGANLRNTILNVGGRDTSSLWGTSFVGANLDNTNFRRTDMDRVNLHATDLRTTILPSRIQWSNLTNVNLEGKSLPGCSFFDVNFEFANLSGANLSDAIFYGEDSEGEVQISNLTGANLENANLRRAILSNCNLYVAVLINANLRGATLRGANLQNAILTGADLREVDLRNADLRGADLTRADLRDVDLRNADLRGADLTGVLLENTLMFGTNIQHIINDGEITDDNLIGEHIIDNLIEAGANFDPLDDIDDIPPVPGAEPLPAINAYEIHRASHALLNNGKFLDIIGAGEMLGSEEIDYHDEYNIMKSFIESHPNLFNNIGDLLAKMDIIWDRVRNDRPNEQESDVMWKACNFAYEQDERFTAAYITTFIDEAAGAYVCDSPILRLSCTQGIRERFYTSLLGAASLVRTIEGFVPTREIILLSCISKIGNIQKDPNEVIQRWSLQIDNDTWKSNTKEQRIEDFKNFMREDYKDDECYEINREAIEEIINNKASEIDYVFDNNDELVFGGKKLKRKYKKTRKRRKSKTKKKSKIKKNQKSKKK